MNFDVIYIQWRQEITQQHKQNPTDLTERAMATFGRVPHISIGQPGTPPRASAIIAYDAYNVEVEKYFRSIAPQAEHVRPGFFVPTGLISVGPSGILIDLVNRICLIGDDFGASLEFVRWYTKSQIQAEWSSDSKSFETGFNFLQQLEPVNDHLLLTSPGSAIYGHWILDYIPRLHQMSRTSYSKMKLSFAELPAFADFFLENLGISRESVTLSKAKNLLIGSGNVLPGFLKQGYIIHHDQCGEAWRSFAKSVHDRYGHTERSCDKVFLSRRDWHSDRKIMNMAVLESIAEQRGYQILSPETLSIPGQAAALRHARIVVGQDGSALHNIIYSDPGLKLGVLCMQDRLNLWHLSICETLGHRIAFLRTQRSTENQELIDPTAFSKLLDRLEEA
jgi:hypothetical protein